MLPAKARLLPIVLLFGLSACLPTKATPSAPSLEPPATPSPTFEFPTLAPTATEGRTLPTTEAPLPLAGAGEVLYQAIFSEASEWPLGQDSFGTISIAGDSLSVVIPQPNLTRLIASPAPPTSSFILDLTLRSEVCQGTDEYGLAFWLNPEGDHMRFTLTCEGGYRLRRVLGSERRAWVPFVEREAAILPGAPAENRLTVRSQGNTFRLYINGFHVLSGTEPSLSVGSVGLVATSSRDSNQLTILFNSLTLYELDQTRFTLPQETEPSDG